MILFSTLRSRRNPIPAAIGLLSALVGIVVLLVWAIDGIPLKSLVSGLTSMKPDTALGFVLIGGALWFSSLREPTRTALRLAQTCALLVTVIGGLTALEYILEWNPGFDQRLFRESPRMSGPWFPGRMGLNTALCFSLFGGALLLNRRRSVRISSLRESATLGGILFAFVALLGYLYEEKLLYGIGQYTAMALHTSLTLLAVGAGLLFLHSDRGLMAVVTSEQAGGQMLRRLLPGVLLALPAIGWIRLLGERRGFYEEALGVAIYATSATVALLILLWWTARSLNCTAQAHDLAQQARDESERRFRQLAETIREVFWLSDPAKNQVLYISPAYETIWARSCESLYASPTSWVEAIHPDDRERIWQAATTKQLAGTYDEEYRILTPDGSVRWIHDRAFPVLNDQGRIYRIAGIAEDVTKNKRTEEALRESEERFEKAFRSSPHPVGVTELESGICLDANDACLSLFGFRREEVLGTSTLDLQIWPNSDDRARFVRLLRSQGAVHNLEVTLRTKQKELRQFLCSSELIDLKGTPCIVTVGNDITDRKRAEEALRRAHVELEQRVRDRTAQLAQLNAALEEQLMERKRVETALRESDERLRAFLDHAPNLAFVKAADGRYLYVNRRFEEVFHFEPDTVLGRTDVDLFPREQADQFQLNDRRVLASGEAEEFEELAWHADGLHTSIVVKFPLRDASGHASAIAGIVTDITDRKRAEEELRSAYRQLRDLTHRLETARETERQRISRELHDEFGQALTGMKLDLSWLGAKLARALPTTAGKPLVKKTQSLMASVDALIDAVRETATSLRPGMLDDFGLIPALEWLTKDFSRRTGIECKIDIGPEAARVQLSDEFSTALFRIVQELLTNVIRHAQASTVQVRLSETDEQLLLELSDDGAGISPHQITRSGSLGLRGMQERASLLGGSFTISGAPGVGTTARIALPKTSLPTSHEENVR